MTYLFRVAGTTGRVQRCRATHNDLAERSRRQRRRSAHRRE